MNFSITSIALIAILLLHIVTAAIESPDEQTEYAARLYAKLRPFRMLRRAHNIDTRGLNNFKNCYFSPIQCVLMDRKRK
ncbi:unnamed protein product [Caenorhabditis bovis]|uniref:Uncharacterized protein n=1 Tax=Caenorhabditis bovis TaxID=2654633 RepID=A0A8S1FCY7_9PELO|nr:unnamed protein product [Caenorhabditis bovis]